MSDWLTSPLSHFRLDVETASSASLRLARPRRAAVLGLVMGVVRWKLKITTQRIIESAWAVFIFYISLKLLQSTTEGTHPSGDSFVMIPVSVGHLVSVAGTYKNIR